MQQNPWDTGWCQLSPTQVHCSSALTASYPAGHWESNRTNPSSVNVASHLGIELCPARNKGVTYQVLPKILLLLVPFMYNSQANNARPNGNYSQRLVWHNALLWGNKGYFGPLSAGEWEVWSQCKLLHLQASLKYMLETFRCLWGHQHLCHLHLYHPLGWNLPGCGATQQGKKRIMAKNSYRVLAQNQDPPSSLLEKQSKLYIKGWSSQLIKAANCQTGFKVHRYTWFTQSRLWIFLWTMIRFPS